MGGSPLVCPRCGTASPPGMRYCPTCGEVIEPELIATLRWLYTSLRDLDARIAAGQGQRTLEQLRDEYRERYLALRTPAPAAVTRAPDASAVAAVPVASVPANDASAPAPDLPAPVSSGTQSAGQGSAQPPRPPQPVFSWRAFLAEQAIAIMAYMGGFLLLVATLSFEIGGWQALSLGVKLGAVCAVYAVFGVLGFFFRRSPRLRMVGGAYLAVFALLTPLLALGIYRFGLQGAGFPVAGMLCLSAWYASVIYLMLAWHTRFATYAYLGWTALLVGALAAVRWADAPTTAWLLALALAGIILLVPLLLRRRVQRVPVPAVLEPPATQLGALVSAVALAGTTLQAISLAPQGSSTPDAVDVATVAALALAAVALVPLTAGWSLALRHIVPPSARASRLALVNGLVDWLIAATFAQAVLIVAAWAGADYGAFAVVLAALTLAEAAVVAVVWRVAPARRGLRLAIAWLAVALAASGALLVIRAPSPNWPYLAVLSAGIIATLAIAWVERRSYWLTVAGVFLLFDYHALVLAMLPPALTGRAASAAAPVWLDIPTYHALLVLALWLLAFAIGFRQHARRVGAAIYVVALLDALYVVMLLIGKDHVYGTIVLSAFAVLTLVAGVRERARWAGNVLSAFFGVLATLPLTFGTEADGVRVALVALVPALLALIIRRVLGRVWSFGPYVVALWATVAATAHLELSRQITTHDATFLGIPFAAWLPLVVAVLATVIALWEGSPWAMSVSALLAVGGIILTPAGLPDVGLVLACIATGSLVRWLRGAGWNVALLLVAAQGSAFAVYRLQDQGPAAPHWQVGVLLLLALVAYLVAMWERQPALTILTVLYALVAVERIPGPENLPPTLVMFFAVAAASYFAERRLGWRWALSLYAIEAGTSLFAVGRVQPYDAGTVEALVLLFAATVYAQSVLGRQPWLLFGTVLYAASAAVVQPDAHGLLPLALALAALGLLAGRVGGWRWSWPLYGAALVAAAATALQARPSPGFEALALLALALFAYVVAAVESRPDALPLVLLFGALALAAGLRWGEAPAWAGILCFAALSWLYTLGAWLWGAIPWLRATPHGDWWIAGHPDPTVRARVGDPRIAGRWVHRIAGLLVASATVLVAPVATDAFAARGPATQAEALAMLSLAGLLAYLSRADRLYALRYLAGGLVTLAVTWELRWLGASNPQALVVAPGSYLMLIGALLPADARLRHPARLGQVASLAGALVLLVPTVAQSFTEEQEWIYALVLAVEALVITAVGVGTHARLLVLVGTGFVGLAALRGVVLAFDSGVPVALIIAAIAALLLGGATWLSLRGRRDTDIPSPAESAPAPSMPAPGSRDTARHERP